MPTATDIAKGYANRNLETQLLVNAHIFPGALGELTAADTLVVNATNYKTKLTDAALGRLVRFEGLEYKAGTFDGDTYPQLLEEMCIRDRSISAFTNGFCATISTLPSSLVASEV